MNSYILKNKKGFTLVELMVAVSIFAIVMTISMGAILSIIDTSKKAQSLKSVMSNLNYALEDISRQVKTSRSFSSNASCGYTPSNPAETQYQSNSLSLVNSEGTDVTYALSSDNKVVVSTVGVNDTNNFDNTPITAEEVRVQYLCFLVEGEDAGDGLQPKVTIVIKGVSGDKAKTQSQFQLQTTVSKRVIQS